MQVKTKAIVSSQIPREKLDCKMFYIVRLKSFCSLCLGENQIKNRLFSTSYYFRNRGSTQEQRHLRTFKEINFSDHTFRYFKNNRDVHIRDLASFYP
jgi:hypothetical protein